jgi:hypothetical protein
MSQLLASLVFRGQHPADHEVRSLYGPRTQVQLLEPK